MDRLTIEQRVKIIKTYYKSGESNVATFRALRDDYGRHNRPTTQAIGKIVKKFEEIGSVTDILRPVHHRNARTEDNIAAVSKSIADNPNLSIRLRSKQLGICASTVRKIVREDLGICSINLDEESCKPKNKVVKEEEVDYD